MSAATRIQFDPENDPLLAPHPVVYLSAGIPRNRQAPQAPDGDNKIYLDAAQPDEVRAAVAHFCRFAFQRDLTVLFGAQPGISPLVLQAARYFGGGGQPCRVIIVQSEYFAGKIPSATVELARLTGNAVRWTPRIDVSGQSGAPDPDGSRKQSLRVMRDRMVRAAGIVAGVFIGGMDGVVAEFEAFGAAQERAGQPRYAVGSTGSGAAEILRNNPGAARGRRLSAASLGAQPPSYPVVMQAIFDDLGVP